MSNVKWVKLLEIGYWKLEIRNSMRSQAGVGQLLVIMLLVVGVGLGTYLVQSQSQLFSQAASSTKATIGSRTESVGADGVKEIKFTWSDGRVSYDFKNADGNLIPGRAYAMRGSQRSTPTGQQVQGTTYITNWSDGTVENNVFTDGKYDTGKSYATSGGSTTLTPQANSNTTAPTTTAAKPAAVTQSKPATTTTNSAPAQTNTTAAKPAAITQTTPATTTTQQVATAPATQTAVAQSSINAASYVTQFQSLQQVFEQSLVAKITAAGKNVADVQKLIDITKNGISTGLAASNECVQTKAADCAQKLPPLLNYAKVGARLTAFYAIINNVPEVCSRADFGIVPLMTATSGAITGPVYLCTSANGTDIKWRIFDNNIPLSFNDPNYPPFVVPTSCSDQKWPQGLVDHLAAAQVLLVRTIPSVCGKSSGGVPDPENVVESPL